MSLKFANSIIKSSVSCSGQGPCRLENGKIHDVKLTLTPKLALIFILFAGLLLIGAGTLAYDSGQAALKDAAITELEATSVEKEAALENWIQEREARISALSRSPYILSELEAIIEAGPESSAAYERLVRELSVRTGKGQAFLNMFIILPEDGQVFVSVDPDEVGDPRTARPYFLEALKTTYTTPIYFSPEVQAPAMTTASPIRSADGRVIGVLAGRVNLQELNSIIQRRTGLRQTDDAFLVNTSNLFVTQPRFIPDPAILQQGISTLPVTLCLQGNTGTISTMDYRNVPVIVSYRWLPERQMCLIVKISQEETLVPIRQFEKNVLLIGLMVLVAASILAVGLSHSLIGPIRAMQAAAQRYGRGDLDVRLPETRQDELGVLASEFNQMAGLLAEKEAELLEHAHSLEQKVLERTKDLREKEYMLSESQSIAHIGSWQYEPAHDRLVWSDETYRIYGRQPETFIPSAESLLSLLHPDERPRLVDWIKECLAGCRPSGIEFRVVLPDGSLRIVQGQGDLLPEDGEKPLRLIGTIQDVTVRKQAEEQINELLIFNAKILNTAPVGILTYKTTGECVFANENAAAIVGTSVETLISQNFRALESWKRSGLLSLAERAIVNRSPVVSDIHHLSTFGRDVWLTASAVTFHSRDEERLLLTISDITERKQAEDALQRTADDLLRSNAELEQFAYVASHDLQEPLRMVSSYVQLLARRYQGRLDADADEFIAFAVDGAKRMQTLINDLLAYSRVGRRGSQMSSVSVENLLQDVLANLQLTIEESRATITHDPLPVVRGDAVQLSTVFQNLVMNAIKFRSAEPPCIHIGVCQEQGEWVFSVKDNGIGIDPKFSERIFIIFQRLHSRESYPGTGIGLAVCKRVIQRHGGRIWVASEAGKGSVFYFTLPTG